VVPVQALAPVLATAGELDPRHEWVVEPKLDGWRALVYTDGGLCVRTRTGRIVTDNLPQLAGLVDVVPDGRSSTVNWWLGRAGPGTSTGSAPQLVRRRGA
jgi:hypothetical protein